MAKKTIEESKEGKPGKKPEIQPHSIEAIFHCDELGKEENERIWKSLFDLFLGDELQVPEAEKDL